MDYNTALKINRLANIESRAQSYNERAKQSGNILRQFRAAKLEMAADLKIKNIMCSEITPCHDGS
jgi:hypothetical protein